MTKHQKLNELYKKEKRFFINGKTKKDKKKHKKIIKKILKLERA